MGTISVSLPSDGSGAEVSQYNTPITTIVNEINGNLDNSNIDASAAIATSKLADDAGITTAKIADGAVTPSKLATGATSGFVATSQSTASTSFTDLGTVGPEVTVTVGANGIALVNLSSTATNTGSGLSFIGIGVSGANTIAASSDKSVSYAGSPATRLSGSFLYTGLTPGSTTFTLKFSVTSGTGTFTDRGIGVVPL